MKTYRFAFRQVISVIFAYIFVGLASGLLLQEAGYSPVWAFLSALFIYAGSMQIVMVSLMVSGAPLYTVALMTLFINARHIFYGLTFMEEFRAMGQGHRSKWKFPYMALTLTDETYSLLCSLRVPEGMDRKQVIFDIQITCHMLWVVSCTAGALLGGVLPVSLTGIEFSATALFVAVVVNQWRESGSHIPAIVGFLSAIGYYFLLGPDQLILPALSTSMVALLLLKTPVERRIAEVNHD